MQAQIFLRRKGATCPRTGRAVTHQHRTPGEAAKHQAAAWNFARR